ncbi:DUF1413 domain-containing protein [Lysinibacillus sp. NPDC097287]|uniref:DUF1413 domain-containing protein n=1 Tax=Lysinibacillus sp. NPDC097287 TaxID=3364144 RepID=UPI0038111DA9
MNQEKLVAHVKNQIINHVNVGDREFTVKDLFDGITWKRLSIGERCSLGLRILNEARYGDLKKHIEVLKKNSANQQLYKKEN